jgi:hypothetical protein
MAAVKEGRRQFAMDLFCPRALAVRGRAEAEADLGLERALGFRRRRGEDRRQRIGGLAVQRIFKLRIALNRKDVAAEREVGRPLRTCGVGVAGLGRVQAALGVLRVELIFENGTKRRRALTTQGNGVRGRADEQPDGRTVRQC